MASSVLWLEPTQEGIEFQGDPRGLPALAEARGEFGEVEAVGRAREGAAEPAIRVLEHVDDAGEAALGSSAP